MAGRPTRAEITQLRARFVANREQVRSWTGRWDCPEVRWPEFSDVPSPWVVLPAEREDWLERHAPFLDAYRWLLEARPVATGVSRVVGNWEFGPGHTFERLHIEMRTFADPAYLAEKLALGAHAAQLKGWQDDDLPGLYEWLLQGMDSRPMADMVRGQRRSGFILFEVIRSPHSHQEINAQLRMTLTDVALDGSPLNRDGRSPAD